jgi:hypothetical protein
MKNLFRSSDFSEICSRIELLKPDTKRQWGKMNVSQMLAHCNKSLETAMGLNEFKQLFIGKIIAPFMRKKVLGEKHFGKNSPTDKSYLFPADLEFEVEKSKLILSLQKFMEKGAEGCTIHPHPFFGHFTPEEWAIFQWKHLDHHLRQFGV